MTSWTEDELTRIGAAEELEIASLRADCTLRNRRTIWVVPFGDRARKAASGPAASTRTSPSSTPATTSMTPSTRRIGGSTAGTPFHQPDGALAKQVITG
jgi:hypothetical protein